MADSRFAARCGIYCGECDYRESTGCPGCIEAGGRMFWGTCRVAACCIEKDLSHCGECELFPCDQLRAFANDPEQGDGGRRIRQLEAWNDIGFRAWLERRDAEKE